MDEPPVVNRPRKRSFNDFARDGRHSNGTASRGNAPLPVDGEQHSLHSTYDYAPEASIVLIGIRGTGKSSLAFLTASAYGRRVVEFDREFQMRANQSLGEHRQHMRDQAGRRLRRDIFQTVLQDNSVNAVIVCDFTDLEYGSSALVSYRRSHPVIYIYRDLPGMKEYLASWSVETITHLSESSTQLLRQCSTHEYFNLTERGREPSIDMSVSTQINGSVAALDTESPQPSLRLKRTERDFLKFLRLILGDLSRSPYQKSAYPLSELPLEKRHHTFAAIVTVEDVLDTPRNFDNFQMGADALILLLPISAELERHHCYCRVAEAFSVLRRATILPIGISSHYSLRWDGVHDRDLLHFSCRLAPEYLFTPDAGLGRYECSSSAVMMKAGPTIKTKFVEMIDMTSYDKNRFAASAKQIMEDVIDTPSSAVIISMRLPDADFMPEITELRTTWTRYKRKHQRLPTLSLFNTGKTGRHSQVTNPGILPVLGADQPSYTGEAYTDTVLSARQVTQALFASFLLDPLKFCIVGANVDYSLSPAMHNAGYVALGMPHAFSTRSAPSLDILDHLASDEDFGGAAITQPYKITATKKIKSLSLHAKVIGAINTIIPMRGDWQDPQAISDLEIVNTRNQSGPISFLHGANTDWIGMRAVLRRGLSPINAVRKNTTGLIIGAGGMARAAVYAMIHMGVTNIFICNRTQSRAEDLANYYNDWLQARQDGSGGTTRAGTVQSRVHVIPSLTSPWPEKHRHPTMIISSVPAETMNGRPQATFTLPPAWLSSPSGGVVVDLTYNPLLTALVGQVKQQAHRGWIIMTGLDMLPEQAFAQFELFTGRRAPRQILREEVLKAFREGEGKG